MPLKVGLKIHADKVQKRFRRRKRYEKELMIYKMNLPYVPKLISHNDKNMILMIRRKCCKNFSDIPHQHRKKYYPALRELYHNFKRDTGYYHNDYKPDNIIVDQNGKLWLIDFENIGSTKQDRQSHTDHNNKRIEQFHRKIGLIRS